MQPELSVVISAYNEEKSVEKVLNGVLQSFKKYGIIGELIFMDNHCTDKTGDIADKVAKKSKKLRVIHRRRRKSRDLGSSLIEGLNQAKGEFVLIMDCDDSHNYQDVKRLFSQRKNADIIIGSRFVKGGGSDFTLKRKVISNFYNFLIPLFLGVKIKDMTTGFKLYNREKVLKGMNLKNNGFGLHIELILKAKAKGCTHKEIPIYYKKSAGKSHLNYKKQFWSYGKPALTMLGCRIIRKTYA